MTLPGGSAEALANEYWEGWDGREKWERQFARGEVA